MKIVIPKTVKVGGFDVTVELVPTRDMRKGDDCNGKAEHDLLQIFVDSDLAEQRQQEVFLHELLHECMDQAGFGREIACPEEEVVSRLSPVLYQVIKDNKLFT